MIFLSASSKGALEAYPMPSCFLCFFNFVKQKNRQLLSDIATLQRMTADLFFLRATFLK